MSESRKSPDHSWLEGVTLVCLMVVIVGLFSIPTVLYFSNRSEDTQDWKSRASSLYTLLENFGESSMNYTLDEQTSEGSINLTTNCSYRIRGSHPCYSDLRHLFGIPENKTTGHLPQLITVTSFVEASALAMIMHYYKHVPADNKCLQTQLPRYCRFLYSPCTDQRVDWSLTREECLSMESVCEMEFTSLSPLHPSLVPDCNAIAMIGGGRQNLMETSTNNKTAGEITCHHDYVKTEGLCLFSCSRAVDLPIPPGLSLPADDICQCIIYVLVIIFGSVFIMLALVKRKEMLKFPTVLLLYSNVLEMFIVVVILIGFAGGPGIFCSYPDFLRTVLSSPTAYCTISGLLFHFGSMAIFTTWILHLGYIIVLLMFPFYGEQVLKKKANIIHAISVPLVLLVTSIPPIVAVSTDGYSVIRFPPSLCFPSTPDLTYYTLSLPLSIILSTLAIQCVFLLFLLHKSMKMKAFTAKENPKGNRIKKFFSVPEIKILLLALVFVIFGVLVLIRLSYTLSSVEEYFQSLLSDGVCHLFGENSGTTCQEREPLVAMASTAVLAYIIALFGPTTNVVFVLSLSGGKRRCTWCGRGKQAVHCHKGVVTVNQNASLPQHAKYSTVRPDNNIMVNAQNLA